MVKMKKLWLYLFGIKTIFGLKINFLTHFSGIFCIYLKLFRALIKQMFLWVAAYGNYFVSNLFTWKLTSFSLKIIFISKRFIVVRKNLENHKRLQDMKYFLKSQEDWKKLESQGKSGNFNLHDTVFLHF